MTIKVVVDAEAQKILYSQHSLGSNVTAAIVTLVSNSHQVQTEIHKVNLEKFLKDTECFLNLQTQNQPLPTEVPVMTETKVM